ncbi:MAG: periplasmic heavy metal sensor [Candidatus Omnitrophota bacterium]
MRKTRLVMIGLVVSLLTISSVYAQTQNVGKPDGARAKEGIYKELNLTPEQKQKLEENRKAHREKATQLRTEMMEKEKQLQQALKDPAVIRANVEPLINEIKVLQGQLIDQRVNGIFVVKEILTPEQVVQLHQLMEKRKAEGKGRFQERQNKHKGLEAEHGDK